MWAPTGWIQRASKRLLGSHIVRVSGDAAIIGTTLLVNDGQGPHGLDHLGDGDATHLGPALGPADGRRQTGTPTRLLLGCGLS